MKKKGLKSKVIDFSKLLSFRNNSEELLRAYSNGSLRAVSYSPVAEVVFIESNPDIETVINDDALGFYIVN